MFHTGWSGGQVLKRSVLPALDGLKEYCIMWPMMFKDAYLLFIAAKRRGKYCTFQSKSLVKR